VRGEVVEVAPSITVPSIDQLLLNDPLFSVSLKSRGLLPFGAAMFYAKRFGQYNLKIFAVDDQDVVARSSPHLRNGLLFRAVDHCRPGDELIVGSETLKEKTNETVEEMTINRHSIDYLRKNGVCLSRVYISTSKISGAGRGLFAKKAFREWDVIYVSPVLILPRHEVLATSNDTVLLNYCMMSSSTSNVDVAIFPIGLTAMANHRTASSANMKYRWHDESVLSKEPKYLFDRGVHELSLEYYAARDILKDEELTINYGSRWESAWAQHESRMTSDNVIFRHPIEIPSEMIPQSWNSMTCLGQSCLQSVEVRA
jgi:hypothetical protein